MADIGVGYRNSEQGDTGDLTNFISFLQRKKNGVFAAPLINNTDIGYEQLSQDL